MPRSYPRNDKFFDYIDTPEKAYALGVMATDGSVFQPKHTKSYVVQLHVSPACAELCSMLHKFIGGPPPKFHHKTGTWSWRITCKALGEALIRLGITQRKTHTLQINLDAIPQQLIPYFIHGVFDGDGSIILPKGKWQKTPSRITLNISTASDLFATQLERLLPSWKRTKRNNGRGFCPGTFIWAHDCFGMEKVHSFLKDMTSHNIGLAYKLEQAHTAMALIEKSNTFKRIHNNKLSRVYAGSEAEASIVQLFHAGLPYKEIAIQIQVSRAVVSKTLKRNKLRRKKVMDEGAA